LAKPMTEYTWKDLTVGNVVDEPGNSTEYHTGDWKSQRPQWNQEKCIRCGVCWNFCPDNAIEKRPGEFVVTTRDGKKKKYDHYFVADLEYCKGCGICAHECITGCIEMIEEVD
jgi:pyruvate ferredoxin oxidoreductase delta subunit